MYGVTNNFTERETVKSIDINSDCGESFGNWRMGTDADIIPEITTANVACGFHAGDPMTMQRAVAAAQSSDTVVGAHPGLPDLLGLGRRRMVISPEEAYAYILYQVGALRAILNSHNMTLHHIKPHGALYMMLNDDVDLARPVVRAIQELCPQPRMYWPGPVDGLVLPELARDAGIEVVSEVYFDREYDNDGRLIVPREQSAIDLDTISERVRIFLHSNEVITIDNDRLKIDARSICVHGDGPNARELLAAIKVVLAEEECRVEAVSHNG